MVPGGEIEPPRPCDRRILSPISSRSHYAAANGKKMHVLPAQVFAWIFSFANHCIEWQEIQS
jgi:hypothetical protein